MQVRKNKIMGICSYLLVRMWSSLSSRHLEAQHNINVELQHVAETSISNDMFAWDSVPQQAML